MDLSKMTAEQAFAAGREAQLQELRARRVGVRLAPTTASGKRQELGADGAGLPIAGIQATGTCPHCSEQFGLSWGGAPVPIPPPEPETPDPGRDLRNSYGLP